MTYECLNETYLFFLYSSFLSLSISALFSIKATIFKPPESTRPTNYQDADTIDQVVATIAVYRVNLLMLPADLVCDTSLNLLPESKPTSQFFFEFCSGTKKITETHYLRWGRVLGALVLPEEKGLMRRWKEREESNGGKGSRRCGGGV